MSFPDTKSPTALISVPAKPGLGVKSCAEHEVRHGGSDGGIDDVFALTDLAREQMSDDRLPLVSGGAADDNLRAHGWLLACAPSRWASRAHDGTRLSVFTLGPLRLRSGGFYQFPNAGRLQIRTLRNPDVANPFALASEQATRIGQLRAEVEAQVDPLRVSRGEHECVAGFVREREVIGDGVQLIDELTCIWRLGENQASRGQREFSDHVAVWSEQSEVRRIGWTQTHWANLSKRA